jgi:hypothetical protein
MAALATSVWFATARASAQVTTEPAAAIFPDPAKFARGLYTEGEIGGVAFFGRAAEAVGPGFAIGTRVGYDINRFVAAQVHVLGSTHETKGDGPLAGQLIQTYQGMVEGKATLRFGQTSLFAEGGIGVTRFSTNLLYTLGIGHFRTGLTLGGGGGFDYHSLSRHFSVGVRAGYNTLRDVPGSQDLVATTYLRYTF